MVDTRDRIREIMARVAAIERALPGVADQELARASEAVVAARESAESSRRSRLDQLSDLHAQEVSDQQGRLDQSITALAPGLASASWSDDWSTLGSVPARYVRIGTARATGAGPPKPVVVPGVGHAGLFLQGDRMASEDVLAGVLLRLVAQTPLKHLNVTVFDPRVRSVLGQFAGLRRAGEATFPTPTADPSAFSEKLTRVMTTVPHLSEAVAAAGASDLVEHWQRDDVPEGVVQVVVVLDYPYSVDQRVQDQLVRLAASQSPARPTLLVLGDESARPEQGVEVHDLLSRLHPVRLAGGSAEVGGYPGARTVADTAPPVALVTRVVEDAVRRSALARGPVIPLEELLATDVAEPWTHDASESLDLILGRVGRDPLEISLRTANPPHPNVLIGGAVGQGKSNLLLDLLYGLAVRYGPDELEYYLLDFKQGVEFKQLGPDERGENWLPHVRVLGLESNQAFGLAVLRHLDGELGRRAEAFKAVGARDLAEHRRAGVEKLPRIVLVVDEFHELLADDGDSGTAAVEILERVARTGRALGVHLVLASQTIAGVRSLALKGDAIFAQFPLRISLKNTVQESQTILSQGNRAAAGLQYRGEAIVNRDFGLAGSNEQRGIVAYAGRPQMLAIQRRLWSTHHREAPTVFIGTQPSPWPTPRLAEARSQAGGRSEQDGLEIWVGRPLAVSEAPRTHVLRPDADQAVAVIGTDPGTLRASLLTLVSTAALSLDGSGRIVVLDGDGPSADEWVTQVREQAPRTGVEVERVARDDVPGWLSTSLRPRLDGSGPATGKLLIVGLSLQRIRGMDVEETGDTDDELDFSFAAAVTGRSVLQRLAREGGLTSSYLIGSWNGARTMEDDLGAYSPGAALVVTTGVGLQDLKSVAGPHATQVVGTPRLGVVDRTGSGELEVLVPYTAPPPWEGASS